MEKLDKKDPQYGFIVGNHYRTFIHGGYHGTGIEKPGVGIKTMMGWVNFEKESPRIKTTGYADQLFIRKNLLKALDMYLQKKLSKRILDGYADLKKRTEKAEKLDEFVAIIVEGVELLRSHLR